MSFSEEALPSTNPALNVACSGRSRPPRLFHDVAAFLLVLTHSCLENMIYLPFPVGTIIKHIENLLDPWTHPFVEALEGFVLGILAAVDGKIYNTTSGSIKGCILCTSVRLKSVTSHLLRRGLIGMSADFWVKNEAALKEHVQTAIDFANKYPLLRLFTHVFGNLSSHLAAAVSDWLVKQSEVEDKSIQSVAEESVAQGELQEPEANAIELRSLRPYLEDASLKETFVAAANGFIVEDQVACLKEGFGEEEIEEVKKLQEDNGPQPQKDEPPDVLELIEIGWLLGASSSKPRKISAK